MAFGRDDFVQLLPSVENQLPCGWKVQSVSRKLNIWK